VSGRGIPRTLAAILLCAGLSACAGWLFSPGMVPPDRTRPVVRIETRDGVEYGAATSEGILFLNQRGSTGPCRVHYFLGHRLMVDSGEILPFGGVYHEASVDLKHQWAPVLTRDLREDDQLYVILMAGRHVRRERVFLSRDYGVEGDLLEWPGHELPAGTGVWVKQDEQTYLFAGLISALAELKRKDREAKYYLFTGPARLREALAQPRRMFRPRRVKHRRDDITVIKEAR
jgi:hypothetical protein